MNIPLATDSYKLGHWRQYPDGIQTVYSYLEARTGATYPETVFFGLQPIIRTLAGAVVSQHDVNQAASVAAEHLHNPDLFNREGWEHIVNEHKGNLPLRIKAVPEGTPVPVGNVMMTVENTCPKCFWLTNAVESLLMHVWYPCTVATRSREVKKMLAYYLERTAESADGLPFMLHDFGYRGATTHEAAEIGGCAHLVNFLGTDTVPALRFATFEYYAHDMPGFSVPATEHSVMTALGRHGEKDIVADLIDKHPDGILSVVADSFDIYGFVDRLATDFRERVMARDGVFVVRPDSVTLADPSPEALVVRLLEKLWQGFGGEENAKGYKVLDPHVRLIWGDGIDDHGIRKIMDRMMLAQFSAENIVFGMGGGLLQKLDRDTQRFAFKASAMKINDEWSDVHKEPLDTSKTSKAGRLGLFQDYRGGKMMTLGLDQWDPKANLLRTVFEDGELVVLDTLEMVRERAKVLPYAYPVAA